MNYESQLHFITEIMKRRRINADIMTKDNIILWINEYFSDTSNFCVDLRGKIEESLSRPKGHTVYKLTDDFYRSFLWLPLPVEGEPGFLAAGPFLSSPLTEQEIYMLCEKNGISPIEQKHLAEYYGALPVVTPDSDTMLVFNTFCEFLWQDPAFITVDLSATHSHTNSIEIKLDEENDSGGLFDAKSMERRYSFENQMIRAVSLGQLHMESRLFSSLSGNLFETRVADPIRNSKNYCIIMNTLLRKGAEAGGVHPLHINRLSSDFAKKIEELPSLSDVASLMTEMFRAYCRLVRKHSVKKYSPPVRRAILKVDADLSAELTPGRLAKEQNISLGYLSSEFSREVGKTLAAFIRERRMEYAAYLLSTTELQIQTVAQHCGILDVQYFSKLFKAHHGKTPTEYRKHAARSPQATL